MSDNVIRFGGSHLNNDISLKNLQLHLQKLSGRKIIVVSAIPELLKTISFKLNSIYQQNNEFSFFEQQIHSYYAEIVNNEVSENYKLLSEQLLNLLKGIALIGDYSRALQDQVLCYAERLSVEIAVSRWEKLNGNARVLFPEDIELTTTSDYGNATFLKANHEKINKKENGTYFFPGSYGIDEKGKNTRTGYTAADYSAAFLTKALGASYLTLWDLDFDFQRADSKIINQPQTIKRLTYAEASELAYFDHYSFHPRTIEPLEQLHIPIRVLDSLKQDSPVKTIINTETYIEKQIVKGVAYSDDISLLKLDGPGVGLKPGILAKVTSSLNNAGINIKSVITSQTSINILLGKKAGENALKIIQKLGFSAVTEISVADDITLIGIIGHGMQNSYGVSAKIFTAVANNKINVVLSGSGASDLVSYLVVQKSDKEKSVREIFHAFFNEQY